MKMKAAVLREAGLERPYATSHPLSVEEVDLEGPGAGQVLVQMVSAGLCHSDLSAIAGLRPRALPSVAGHEGAGVVVEIGPGIDDLAVGDHVVMLFVSSCGHCEYCRVGRPNLCRSSWESRGAGTLPDGTRRLSADGRPLNHWSGISSFAEYAVVARASVVRIDAAVPLLDAAVFGCAVVTGVGSVLNTAAVRPGERVAVTGLGGVGLSAVMGAALAGASTVIAIDTVAEKLQLALELGATHAIDARAADARQQVLDLTDGGVDYSFEMAGVKASLEGAYGLVRRGGALVVCSLPAPGVTLDIPMSAHVSDEKQLLGSYMGSAVPARDIPRYVDLYRQGRLPVHRLRSAVLEIDEVNAGFDRLADGRSVRDVVGFAA